MKQTFFKASREFTERFNSNNENRVINHGHVNRIKEQMKQHLDVFPPITINEVTNNIIDGQHRLKAFQKLVDEGDISKDSQISVMYVNIPISEEKESIINANTNSKNWSLDDYIASYSKCNSEYKKLNEWCQSHTLCTDGKKSKFRYGAAMLKGVACAASLKDGSFFLTEEDIERGEKIHTELVEIVGVLGKPIKGNYFEYMAVSWNQVREWHSFKEWLKEFKLKKNAINKKPFANKKDWDNIFADIHRAINLKNN
jgi:hypothetical protein